MSKTYDVRTCGKCGGYGMVSHYSYNDFEGPKECDCAGGQVVVYKNGAVAAYPGGPFVACWPASEGGTLTTKEG